MEDDGMVNHREAARRDSGGKKASCQANRAVGMLTVIVVIMKTDGHEGNQTDNDDKKCRFFLI